jgi:hypothetical protein
MVGRLKAIVAYPIKAGRDRERTATVHAALIVPLEALGL